MAAPLASVSAPRGPSAADRSPDTVVPDLDLKKEVVQRTAMSMTESNADGTFTTTISSGRPMHFRDSDGTYKPFRNELRPTTTGGFAHANAPDGNGFQASFETASDVAAGRPVIRFAAGGGAVSMTALGAKPGRADVGTARIEYKDAYPGGVALSYELDNERLKETTTIPSAAAAALNPQYSFDLSTEGVTAVKRSDNSIDFLDASGTALFRMPRPFMIDSSGVPESEYSDAISLTLTEMPNGKYRLELTPDPVWLAAPARVYPVRLDPTVERLDLGATGQDVHLLECCLTQNMQGSPEIHVGKNPSNQRRDTLIQFPALSNLPQDTTVIAASLKLWADSGTNNLPMEVHANIGAWSESTATWSNQANNMGPKVWYNVNSIVPGQTQIRVNSLVRYWVWGRQGNHGFRLTAPAAAANQSVPFHSSDSTDATKRPLLTVTYMPATRVGMNSVHQYTGQDHGGGNSSSVNLSTGNVVFTHSGGGIATRGFEVDLTHTYNSQDPYGQTDYYDRPGAVWGEGWTFSQNLRLYERDNGRAVVFKDPSGGADRVFSVNTLSGTTQNYFSPLYYGMKLTKDVGSPPADAQKVYKLVPDSGGQSVYEQTMYFDGGGKLRRIEDRNNNYLTYTYDTDATNISDPNGKLTRITDVAGRNTTLAYSGSPARLSQITDMAGRVSTYTYDSAGNLTTIKHGVGTTDEVTTTLGYGISGHLTSVTNPRGYTSYVRYKVENHWASGTEGWVADANTVASHSTLRGYNGANSLKLTMSNITDAAGGGTSKTFATPVSWNSVQGELLAFVWAPAGSQLNAYFVLKDSRNNTTVGPHIPLAGGQWTAVRMPDARIDPAYKIKQVMVHFRAQAGTPAFTGDVWLDHLMVKGVAASLTDSKSTPNTMVSLGYNWDAKQTTESRPNHQGVLTNTVYTYDRFGMTTDVSEPGHAASTASYDEERRQESATSEGSTTSLTYHQDSVQAKTVTSTASGTTRQGVDTSTGNTEYTIDERNERKRTKTPAEPFVAAVYTYNSTGGLTSIKVNRYAAGANLDANPMPAPQQTLRETQYTYGTGGLMTSMTDPNGNVTNYSYDTAKGYMTGYDTPPGTGEGTSRRVTTIQVGADGQPTRMIDPKQQSNGKSTTYEYDGLGRLKKINYGVVGTTPEFSTTRTYDDNGNLTQMQDSTGTTTYTYDENDRLLSEQRAQNSTTKTASYTYHVNGQPNTMTPPAGGTVTYGYNADGELVSQTDPKNGGQAINFAHDHTNHTATTTFPSGVNRTETYDLAGRVKSIQLKNSSGTTLQSFSYDYGLDTNGDPTDQYHNGFVLGVTENGGSAVSYGYDDLGRLVTAVRTGTYPYDHTYGYDANDNRTSVTTVDGGTSTTTTATYDAANQMVAQGGATYVYDRNGNLLSYGTNTLSYDAKNKWTGGTVNGQSVSFGYDGQGRRVSRTVGGARTEYWYDQTGMSLETGASSGTYLRGPNGELLSRYVAALANYNTDHLGNVTALTDGQTVVNRYIYDPWGQEVGTTGTYQNPFRYTGTYLDTATDLYQMGARYYQSGSGRFTQLDPLGSSIFEGQRFGYTPANPTNFTDPSGLHYIGWCPGNNEYYSGGSWWLNKWWQQNYDHCETHKLLRDLRILGMATVLAGIGVPYYIAYALTAAIGVAGFIGWIWWADNGRGIYIRISIRPSLWIGGQ